MTTVEEIEALARAAKQGADALMQTRWATDTWDDPASPRDAWLAISEALIPFLAVFEEVTA